MGDQNRRDDVVGVLREAGARFAFIHGSTARGTERPTSDLDIAAWWSGAAPPSFDVLLPAGLELAGRVALEGVLLFDDDPAARVGWLAQTRKIYSDEKPRIDRSHREFAESLIRGR